MALITERQVRSIEKRQGYITRCRFCGKACDWSDSEYSYTKRRELVAVHRSCYNFYYFGRSEKK